MLKLRQKMPQIFQERRQLLLLHDHHFFPTFFPPVRNSHPGDEILLSSLVYVENNKGSQVHELSLQTLKSAKQLALGEVILFVTCSLDSHSKYNKVQPSDQPYKFPPSTLVSASNPALLCGRPSSLQACQKQRCTVITNNRVTWLRTEERHIHLHL